jgi:hypothetical protein
MMEATMTIRTLAIALTLHFAMAVFTYGHAYREDLKANQQDCQHYHDPDLCWNLKLPPGLEAWVESFLWPYHWSAYFWSKQ